jgi:hypothetical protein
MGRNSTKPLVISPTRDFVPPAGFEPATPALGEWVTLPSKASTSHYVLTIRPRDPRIHTVEHGFGSRNGSRKAPSNVAYATRWTACPRWANCRRCGLTSSVGSGGPCRLSTRSPYSREICPRPGGGRRAKC